MIDTKIVEEMKRCAERATPGPWSRKRPSRSAGGSYSSFDADHIAASNPRNVLDLIADYESLLDRYNYPGR